MKTTFSIIIFAIFLFSFSINTQAQKVILESGSLSEIKKEKNINIQYDYSSFAVGKFKTEEEYTKTKVNDYNEKEKGKGDKWLTGWVGARKERYEPKFLSLINKEVAKSGAKYSESPDAKYTLIVKTTFIEPGYNIGIAKYPAFANFDFIFVETSNPTVVVAKLYVQNVAGAQAAGFDYDVSSRVAESYAKAGKVLGKYIMKSK